MQKTLRFSSGPWVAKVWEPCTNHFSTWAVLSFTVCALYILFWCIKLKSITEDSDVAIHNGLVNRQHEILHCQSRVSCCVQGQEKRGTFLWQTEPKDRNSYNIYIKLSCYHYWVQYNNNNQCKCSNSFLFFGFDILWWRKTIFIL